VFWVHASSATRFEEGYKTIAERVQIAGWKEPDSQDETVRAWDIASSAGILCCDAGTHVQKIKFSDDSTKIMVNDDLFSISSDTFTEHHSRIAQASSEFACQQPRY
jgi:hypothetical protein